MLDKLVRHFPRRVVAPLKLKEQEKFVSHFLFLSRTLDEGVRNDPPADLEFGLADESTIRQMIAHPEAFLAKSYYQRLDRGDHCYFIAQRGRVRSYYWVSHEQCTLFWGESKQLTFHTLQPGEAYLYDLYTYRDYRGRGFGAQLLSAIHRELSQGHVVRLFNAVHHDNLVSLMIHRKFGYRLEGIYHTYQLMGWQGVLQSTGAEVQEMERWLAAMDLPRGNPEMHS